MSSFLDAFSNIWIVLLYVTVMIASVTIIAVAMFAWNERPTKKDELQRYKVDQRLSQIMHEPTAPPKKFA